MTRSVEGDKALIQRLSEIVNGNLENGQFGVEEFAREAGLSRSYLHRRLKAAGHKSISSFIRTIRLERAFDLLQEGEAPASEIAYRVGFGSPSYFNHCFHEHFGFPPGEVKKRGLIMTEQSSEPDNLHMHDGQSRLKSSYKKIIVISLGIFTLVLFFVLFRGFIKADIHIRKESSADKSIVVLPFKNFTGNSANQYFADGITEEILNSLCLISDLRVISRTTSDHFGRTDLTAGEIAAKVNTSHVLEGSIRQEGDKIRISIQLIDGSRDMHIWSENFDSELNNTLGIQGEVAMRVAKILDGVIHENEEKRITKIRTRNPEAYDNYLKGRFLLHQSTTEQRSDINREGLSSALKYFEKAVAADTNFVEAYAGLAYTWFNISAWGYLPVKEGFSKAREICRKILKIDPDCAEAHAVMGACYIWGERKFEEGRKELMTALRLNPNYTPASQWHAQLLMITGPLEEARKHMDRTLKMEPYFWVNHNLNAWIYYFEENYDKAIEACRNAYDLNPDFLETDWLFFLNFAKLEEGDKALEELIQIANSSYDTTRFEKEIKIAYDNNGIPGLFQWLIDANLNNPVPAEGLSGHPFFMAWWHAIMGNIEMSVYWLEKNMVVKNKAYRYFNLIATNPDFDFLRDNPRFLAIVDQLGLTPYHTKITR